MGSVIAAHEWPSANGNGLVFLEAMMPDLKAHAGVGCSFASVEPEVRLRGLYQIPRGWSALGYVHRTSPGSWYQGIPLEPGLGFVLDHADLNDFMLSEGSKVSVLFMPMDQLRKRLDRHRERRSGRTGFPRLFRVEGSSQSACLQQHFKVMHRRLGVGSVFSLSSVSERDADGLLDSYLDVGFATTYASEPTRSREAYKRYRTIRRAEDFMRDNLQSNIYLNDISSAAEVSDRSLRYAFSYLFDLSPMRYLTLMRLNMACRLLMRADASRRSVKSIALSCGLWDLSRFARSYCQLFGELPRDTLMRPAVVGCMGREVTA